MPPLFPLPTPLPWTKAAQAAAAAMRGRAYGEGFVSPANVISAWLFGTPVGVSIVGGLLRDSSICPNPGAFALVPAQAADAYPQVSVELDAEGLARAEGARVVGERHLLKAWVDKIRPHLSGPHMVDLDRLVVAVTSCERGEGFEPAEIQGWHGLVDANVVVEHADLKDIRWQEEVGAKRIVLWIPLSLLNELDRLGYSSSRPRVRDRARRFGRDLAPTIDDALRAPGIELRNDVRLRVWSPGTPAGQYDNDHLDAALTLRDRGLTELRVVTGDLGMLVRARTLDFQVHRLSERWRLSSPLQENGSVDDLG